MCLRTKKKIPYKTQNYRDMVMKIYIGIRWYIINPEIHNSFSYKGNSQYSFSVFKHKYMKFYSVNTKVLILLIFVQVIILGMYNIIITPSSDLFPDWSRLI